MKVAMKHYNSNPRIIRCNDNTIYQFEPKRQISLAYVDERHVAELLTAMGGCCGNRRLLFSRATDDDIRKFEGVVV